MLINIVGRLEKKIKKIKKTIKDKKIDIIVLNRVKINIEIKITFFVVAVSIFVLILVIIINT